MNSIEGKSDIFRRLTDDLTAGNPNRTDADVVVEEPRDPEYAVLIPVAAGEAGPSQRPGRTGRSGWPNRAWSLSAIA